MLQILPVRKGRVTVAAFLFYPFFYLALGLAWAYFSKGYVKNWAPVSAEVAHAHSLKWILIVLCIAVLAFGSSLYSLFMQGPSQLETDRNRS